MVSSLISLLALPWFFGSVTVQSYICQQPAVPVIVSPAPGSKVSAGAIQFSGTATASSMVTISVDSVPAVQTTASQNNSFSAQATLSNGKHAIDVYSDSPCGSQAGNTIMLHAVSTSQSTTGGSGGSSLPGIQPGGPIPSTSSEQPTATSSLRLVITVPASGYVTKSDSVYTSGTVSEPAIIHLFVNGKEVGRTLLSTRTFGLTTPLDLGINTITVQAMSDSGKKTSGVTYVTRVATHTIATQTKPGMSKPWWRTLPGAVIIVALLSGVIGLTVWKRRQSEV